MVFRTGFWDVSQCYQETSFSKIIIINKIISIMIILIIMLLRGVSSDI